MKFSEKYREAIIAVSILLILVVGSCVALYIGISRPRTEYFPDDSIWYCEELELQLSFDDRYYSQLIMDTIGYRCILDGYRGTSHLRVMLQEECPGYRLYATVFEGKYVSLDDSELILQGKDGKTYTFVRTDSSNAIPRESIPA